MWERFSYYGMRALLVLFMTAPISAANPGLGFDDGKAGAIYGLYTSMVYLLALPGGWIADNLWGQRRAVFVGGVIIAMGHFTLAAPLVGLPDVPSFFLGLFFIVVGTGLLKPNVSTMVGDLYPSPEGAEDEHEQAERGAKRDAAFSIFYMGINLGAILGPFVCGTLGEEVNWHWGFSAAGFGMILGLAQYKLGDRDLGPVGRLGGEHTPEDVRRKSRNFYISAGIVAGVAAVMAYLMASGTITLTLQTFATWVGYGILLLVIVFFAYLLFDVKVAGAFLALFLLLVAGLSTTFEPVTLAGQWAIVVTLGTFIVAALGMRLAKGDQVPLEKERLMVIFWLFLLAAIFWSGFEQAGSSMNLFAERLTDRTFGGWEMPTTWLQNVNPIFIVVLAPVFGWLWQWLAHRDADPSIPVKFGLGLLGLAAGFFVISWGAANATEADKAAVAWLVVTYFLHTCGELALSPVGLSSMTKLAPAGRVGQMMGVWFIAAALGNLFAGLVAGQLETLAPSALFQSVAIFTGSAGVVALLVSPGVKRLMGRMH
jgi:POT family proton-dependent oligopeptide transporter